MPRYYIGPHDRIVIDRLEYGLVETTDAGHVLKRTDNLKITETITHDDFDLLRHAADFRLDRDFYAPGKARVRLQAGVDRLRDLSDEEQADILWKQRWCEEFIRLQATDKSVRRTDLSMRPAIARLIPKVNGTSGRKRAGAIREVRDPPDPKTLRTWRNLWLSGGGDPLMLRNGYRRCGNRTPRFSPAQYALLVKHAWRFARRTQPTKAEVYKEMEAAFDKLNIDRKSKNLPPLECPGRSRLYKEIDALPRFKVDAARHHVDHARAKYMPVTGGADAVRPLQRVEMDMWSVQLQTLCVDAGAWESMSEDSRRTVERKRKILCVAIDVASRCILAMRFTEDKPDNEKAPGKEGESAATAIATLEMALSDKTPFVDAAGAIVPWDMCGTPELIATDNGPGFVADKFKAACHDVEISDMALPAKLPHLRGTIERVFRTAHTQLIAKFEGRSFENVVAKGDYPAEKRAVLTVDELGAALIRYVVDVYHNSEHEGLGGETPRAAWLRLTKTFPVAPPPDVHKCRHAFGTDLKRVLTTSGVRVLGIQYQAPELQKLLQDRGFGTRVTVRIDEMNLGQVSVWLGDAWLTVDAPDDTFQDLDVRTWVAVTAQQRHRHADMARLTKPIVLEAIRALRGLADHASRRARLASPKMTADEIDREERQLAIGFEYVHPEKLAEGDGAIAGDLYDRAIKVATPSIAADPAPQPEQMSVEQTGGSQAAKRKWTFKE